MGSNAPISTPTPAKLDQEEDSLSKSLPSVNGFRRNKQEKNLLERRKSKLESLFNKKDGKISTPSSRYSTPMTNSQLNSEDEIDDSYNEPYNPSENNLLLQNCLASIANLREEVDSLRLRNHDYQNKLESSEDSIRQLILERNRLQQQVLQLTQDLSIQQSRAQNLHGEVDTLDLEIDKLKRDNLRLRKLNFNHEELQDKLYEYETELNRSQRAKKAWENKYNQLKIQSVIKEKQKKENRRLQLSLKRQTTDTSVYEKVAWLKESNEKLSLTLQEVTSLASDPNPLQNQVSTLISVVKELSATNAKLKAEVMQCCDALSEYHSTHKNLNEPIQNLLFNNINKLQKQRYNSLPFIKARRKSSISDSPKDDQPIEINNLFDELNTAEPQESPSKEDIKALRHSTSFANEEHLILNNFNNRDSGIYTTKSSLRKLYMRDEKEEEEEISDSEIEDDKLLYSLEENNKESSIPVKAIKLRPNSLSFDFMVLSDVEEVSSTNESISKLRLSHSNSTLSQSSKDLPKIKVDEAIIESESTTAESSIKIIRKKSNNSKNNTTLMKLYEQSLKSIKSDESINRINNIEIIKPLPISLLIELIKELLDRLNKTDPKLLNKELKRTFDMDYLTPISNQLLNNISQNIQLLPIRFQNLDNELVTNNNLTNIKSHLKSRSIDASNDFQLKEYVSLLKKDFIEQVSQFKSLILLVQSLLEEITNMRITCNDLSLGFINNLSKFSKEIPTSPKQPVPSTNYWNSTPKIPPQTQLCTMDANTNELVSHSNKLHPISSEQYLKNNILVKGQNTLDSSSVTNDSPKVEIKQDDNLFNTTSIKRRARSQSLSNIETKKVNPMMVRHGVVDYSPRISINKINSSTTPLSNTNSDESIDLCCKQSNVKYYLKKVLNDNSPNVCFDNIDVNLKSPPISPNLPEPCTHTGINTFLAHRSFVIRHNYQLTSNHYPSN